MIWGIIIGLPIGFVAGIIVMGIWLKVKVKIER